MKKEKDGRMWDVIGEYTLGSPVVPDRSEFLNGHITKKKDQKFAHTALPTPEEYLAWPRYKQQQLEDQEWDRRENGVWFYNDGVPTYITGRHYFYLNYHRYGSKKPDYREHNRRFYWWWEHVMTSPNCLGGYLQTRRRDGKTSRFASIGVEGATRIAFFRFGIQSKNEESAEETVYRKEVIPAVDALKEAPWFAPQMAGSSRPKYEIVFDTPVNQKKGAANMPDRVKGLKSKIFWKESTETALDGDGVTFFLNDEVGKKQKFNSYNRWSVVSKQFEPDGEIVGKGANTTTSDEDDDDSVGMCAQFWNNSNQTLIGPNGYDPKNPLIRTASGLFRLFIPAYEGFKVDEYGRDTAAGKEHFLARRRSVAHDPILLLKEKRANPFTIEEALSPSVKVDCVVNAEHVGHVLSHLAQLDQPIYRRYRLDWTDESKTKVKAMQDEVAGRFYISWLPPDSWLNQVEATGRIKTKYGEVVKWKPLNTHRFGSGADPVDHRDPEKLSGASLTALTLFYKFDEDMEALPDDAPHYWPSHSQILEYAERMSDPNVYFEDVIKAIHFFGCSIFPETNRPALKEELMGRGYEAFISKRPASTQTEHTKNQKNAGAASSPLMIGRYTEEWVKYVSQYVGTSLSKNSRGEVGINDDGIPYDPRRMPFPRTLNQILQFDPNKTTKFDLSVSGGYALCDITRYQPFKSAPAADTLPSLAAFDPRNYFNN
ncbi:hypothetical protein [Hymenobacter metallicola]|uniref:Uncharacterized protein n=1 Tax=Hymenobacter metallicola TaxID=2563114 RepID=A0A4Z0QM50_9BACT|nr:hypothetical protein [Hymenobacter metallicola]TGE29822.1 hypothetical protein E5K02_10285 [Hymenobacter metallicola]